MGFKLPNGSDLSKEQLDIINLPTSKDWVIKGAPGTGKTVMAIYRAGQLARKEKVLLLVYNRPLMLFLSTAIKGEYFKNCVVSTYHQWLSDFYKEEFHEPYPRLSQWEPDWEEIEMDTGAVPVPYYDHVIVDEAQDFPIELLRILKYLSSNITCFIDPNQAIEAGKTSTIDAIKEICVEAPYTLTRNFRNTKEIRDFSAIFCNDGVPAKALSSGKKPIIIQCDDYDDQTKEMVRIILQNKEKSIGVIVNSKNLERVFKSLDKELDDDVDMELYKTMRSTIDFDVDGVKIVSYGTMKGLEFDIVLLPRFEKVKSTDDEVADLNRIYVATSRPLSELYLFYFDDFITSNWIDTFGPIKRNRNLLEWK